MPCVSQMEAAAMTDMLVTPQTAAHEGVQLRLSDGIPGEVPTASFPYRQPFATLQSTGDRFLSQGVFYLGKTCLPVIVKVAVD